MGNQVPNVSLGWGHTFRLHKIGPIIKQGGRAHEALPLTAELLAIDRLWGMEITIIGCAYQMLMDSTFRKVMTQDISGHKTDENMRHIFVGKERYS